MLNNKGQAFSVFELMIAGVVAFAILIVLMTIIGNIDLLGGKSGAKDAIETSLKTVSSGGTATTTQFSIKSNEPVIASSFESKTGLDPKSIMFFKGWFGSNDRLEIKETGSGVSSIVWSGTTDLKARAKVICGSTAGNAADALSLMDPSKYTYDTEALKEYCGELTCCAVVLDKPSQ